VSAAGVALALLAARHRMREPRAVDRAAAAAATTHTLTSDADADAARPVSRS
jgi:hypothetical protein